MSGRFRVLGKLATGAVALSLLTGCQSDGTLTPQATNMFGAAVGAAGGLLVCKMAKGNDTECLLSALVGGVAGYVIADKIDKRDEKTRLENVNAVLTTNQPAGYTSKYAVAETGSTGSVQLLGIKTDAKNRECRQMREVYDKANADAVSEEYTMCKNPDGKWANA